MFFQIVKQLFINLESRAAILLGSRICNVCEKEILPPPLSLNIHKCPQSKFLCQSCVQKLHCQGVQNLICCTIGGDTPMKCVSVYAYQGTARDTIRTFKYRGMTHLGGELAQLLLPALSSLLKEGKKGVIVVAVPLHRKKLKERGFNQSDLIARQLARLAGLKHDSRALIRTRITEPQYGLSKLKRSANVKDAFSASPRVEGKSVILIDDVLTSGATALACRDALMAAGAKKVTVLTVARAIMRSEVEV